MQLKSKIKLLFISLFSFLISCKQNNETTTTYDEDKVISEALSDFDKLQGKWKRIDYPFDTIAFIDTTVKMFEDETNAPEFVRFEISENCPYDFKKTGSNEDFIVLPANKYCYRFKVYKDTLKLDLRDYDTEIIYKKL